MKTLLHYKYLLFAIIATAALLYADFLTYGRFRISLITLFFGIIPLLLVIAHTFRNKNNASNYQ